MESEQAVAHLAFPEHVERRSVFDNPRGDVYVNHNGSAFLIAFARCSPPASDFQTIVVLPDIGPAQHLEADSQKRRYLLSEVVHGHLEPGWVDPSPVRFIHLVIKRYRMFADEVHWTFGCSVHRMVCAEHVHVDQFLEKHVTCFLLQTGFFRDCLVAHRSRRNGTHNFDESRVLREAEADQKLNVIAEWCMIPHE